MTTAKMREVRCCCDARLLGYLPKIGVEERTVKFPMMASVSSIKGLQMEYLEFEIAYISEIIDGKIYSSYAYKSRDYPIEKLRQIPGWVDT